MKGNTPGSALVLFYTALAREIKQAHFSARKTGILDRYKSKEKIK